MGETLSWEPPGDGPWELDDSHFDRPLARYASELFCEGFSRGQAAAFERTGVPMKGISMELVNGLPFTQIVPILGKAADAYKAPPPAWLFKLVSVVHPALRRRARTLDEWMASRGWRADLQTWDEELKPGLTARYTALQEIEIEHLSDQELVDHLTTCGAAFVDNLLAHFHSNPTTIFPVGLFLHEAIENCGCEPLEALAALESRGVRPTRQGASLDAWAEVAREDSDVGQLLADDSLTPMARLDTLRDRDDAVGVATRVWFDSVAYRQVAAGDLANPIGMEVPGALIGQLSRALDEQERRVGDFDETAFWAKVPRARRSRLEELFAEACLVYRLRDERSGDLDAWIGGLTRRALLEAGKRLHRLDRLNEITDVVDLATDELPSLLLRGDGPSAEDLRRRRETRRGLDMKRVPHILGADRPAPPPPVELFSGPAADLINAIIIYRALMEDSAPEPEAPRKDVLEGLAACGGRYTGTARICTDPSHFAAVQPGDVLIARATMPSYNVLLPIVGAVVTDRGGALCHAAIVSREYGLPCVVGTRDATSRIADGDVITVDGDTGHVEVSRKVMECAS
jgi:pyruvate,water dikinase